MTPSLQALSGNDEARFLFAKLEEVLEWAKCEAKDLSPSAMASVLAHLQAHLLHGQDPQPTMALAAAECQAAFTDAWVTLDADKRQIPLFAP